MAENRLKNVNEKKIRRQYFSIPLIILYSLAIAIPYMIFVISLAMGKFDPLAWPSTIWISVYVCFAFSLPFLLLRVLSAHCFGKIVCVLAEEGIHYPGGMLRWETVEKIEYAMDAKPRYKSDKTTSRRVIVYTVGGKHVVLKKAPLRMVAHIRKYRPELAVSVTGASSLIIATLVMAGIMLGCPLYLALLLRSPSIGSITSTHFVVFAVLFVLVGCFRHVVFNAYSVQYRFWHRILPIKWLSYVVLGCYYCSFFAGSLILCYFPNWGVTVLFGIYMGVAQPPVPSRRGHRNRRFLSYEELYKRYVENADTWEKKIENDKEKRAKKKDG